MSRGWLLDTNVVSALHPDRNDLPARAVAWLARREATSFISVVTIIEIESGITRLRHAGADSKVHRLEPWLVGLKTRFSETMIDVDLGASEVAGRLMGEAKAIGRRPDLRIS